MRVITILLLPMIDVIDKLMDRDSLRRGFNEQIDAMSNNQLKNYIFKKSSFKI